MSMELVGPYLQACRKAQRLTQETVAAQLGVTTRTISKWETGRETPGAYLLAHFVEVVRADPMHVHRLLLGKVAAEGEGPPADAGPTEEQLWVQRLRAAEAQLNQEEWARVKHAIEALLRGWVPQDRHTQPV